MNRTWENGKKPNLGPDFCLSGPKLGPKFFFEGFTSTRYCCKLSLYPILRKLNEPNLRKWQKT